MTSGASNIINLATMWIPIMPETSQMEAKAREAGERSRVKFEEGFGSGGSELGEQFADQFSNALRSRLGRTDLGLGFGTMMDKLGEQVDSKLASKLEGKLPAAYKAVVDAQNELARATETFAPIEQRHIDMTDRVASLYALKGQQFEAAATAQNAMLESQRAHNVTTEEQTRLVKANSDAWDLATSTQHKWEDAKKSAEVANRSFNNEYAKFAPIAAKASEAQENYTRLTEAHEAASRKALDTSTLFAGVLGGAVVLGLQGVVSGFESIIELGERVFEGAIEGAKELGEHLIEIGEDYQHLNIQVSEFSSASGEALDSMQASAARVFNTLDVAGKDTGQTLAVLGQRLGLAGQPLEQLTSHVERLEGRFKDLKSTDLATAFMAVGVQGKDADNVLASWLESARNAGESIGQLTSQLAQLGDTLRPEVSGLSPEQLGKWLAEIQEKVPNGQKVIMGLAHAEQEFAKHNESFAEGLKNAAAQIKAAATDSDRERLAEQLFGSRNWSGALDAIQLYTSASSEALHGNGHDIDELLEHWTDLENEIEKFKHEIEGALAPFGIAATKVVETGLNKISGWFTTHHHEFLEKIHQWGDSFLNLLPTIIDVGEGIVAFTGMAGKLLLPLIAGFGQMAAAALIVKGIFTGDTRAWDAGDRLWSAMQKFAETDLDKPTNAINDFLNNMKTKVPGMTKDWDDFNNTVLNTPQPGDFAFPQTFMPKNLPAPSSLPPGYEPHWATGQNAPPATPGGPPRAGAPAPGRPGFNPFTNNPLVPNTPVPPGYTATPSAPSFAPQDQPSGYTFTYGSGSDSTYSGDHQDLWLRVAQAESSGNWSNEDTGHNGHYGGLQFAPGTWNAFGGREFADRADHATADEQMIVADRTAFTGYGGTPPQGLGAWETITNGSVAVNAANTSDTGTGGRVYSAQSGGRPWGFDSGGSGDGKSWTDHAIDTAKFMGDDIASWAAILGRGALSKAGILGKMIAKGAGPFGMVAPLAVEAISPSAHASTSDTMPFNPGPRVPGATEGDNPYAPYSNFRDWLDAKNLGMLMGMWAADRGKQSGGIPGATEGDNPYAPYSNFRDWLDAKNLGMLMGMWAADRGKESGGIGDAPLYGPINHKMFEGLLKAGKGAGGLLKRLWDNNLIGPGFYGKQSGGRMTANVNNFGDPNPDTTGVYDTGPQIPDWWHVDATKLQRLAGLGGWDIGTPPIGGPGDKSHIWWQHRLPGDMAGFSEGGGEILLPPWTPEKIAKLHEIAAEQTGIPYEGEGRATGGRGTKDTVPVWVTPNEYIWNDEATSKYGWLIHGLNEDAQGRGTGVMSRVREFFGYQNGGNPFLGARGFGKGGAAGGQGGVGQVIWSDLEDPSVQASGGDAGVGAINGRDASGGPGSPYSDETNAGGQGFAGHHGHVHTTFTADPFTGEPYNQVPAGSQINPGAAGFPDWVYQLGSMYNLRPATYSGHQEWDGANHGIDWWPMDAWDLSGQKNTHEDNVSLSVFADAAIQVSTGQSGFGDVSGGGYSALDNSTVYGNAGWGGGGRGPRISNAGNGSSGMYGQPGAPGMPGGPGFPTDPEQMTPQQFEIWKTYRGHRDAIQGREDKIKDLEKERDHIKDVEIPAETKKLEDEQKKYDGGDPEKIASINDNLKKLGERLDKIVNTDLPKANEDLKVDKVEARQPMKIPGQKDEAGNAEKEFGSKFLGGIAQSLGFPDIFGGKAPWDFGIVKALGRFTTGFMQGAEGKGGPGYGGGGIPGMGGLPGASSFLDGISGLKLPTNAFQGGVPSIAGGPNTYATAPDQVGRPPGPGTPTGGNVFHIGYQDNSSNTHVQSAGDKDIAASIQTVNNSYSNAQATAAAPAAMPPVGVNA